jgi:3-hydroxy-9,10-secoandrosta-1,3,5(10)-triene-9,17-dione monooxygenase
MGDVEVAGGTAGSRLHANPMYSGRGMTIFTLTLAAITVGAAYNALDEYERLMRNKTTARPPITLRIKDRDYQRWYGRAVTRIRLAEAALNDSAAQHMELCRRNVEDGVPFTYGDDMTLAGVLREVIVLCWEIVDDDLWQTVGASVARDGERMERIFRDMAVAVAHRNPLLRDYYYVEIARAALGEPRTS